VTFVSIVTFLDRDDVIHSQDRARNYPDMAFQVVRRSRDHDGHRGEHVPGILAFGRPKIKETRVHPLEKLEERDEKGYLKKPTKYSSPISWW
jgi:hypothetical protein